MARITEELIRKRAEHNEKIIGTLEELSLHQEDIEKIENINNWCKDIQILYLQANLISKIENLNKLKKLRYLNLALNNIEKIENLERCESLEKLDLTLNFVGDLKSVISLKNNHHLKELNLTGNPCTDYEGYRQYVLGNLQQLKKLDSVDATRGDKIKARQILTKIEPKISIAEEKYAIFRNEQKIRAKKNDKSHLSDEDFWKSSSEHSPESRIEIAMRTRKAKENYEKETDKKEEKPIKLFSKDGNKPLNVNQAKLIFDFNDGNPKQFVLTVHVYKHLDTELIDVDLQPIFVKITIKNKIFQMVFPDEIFIEKSTCRRSSTTGFLVLTMPRLNYKPVKSLRRVGFDDDKKRKLDNDVKKNQFLEVEGVDSSMDFSKIVENNEKFISMLEKEEVPPLEYGF